MIGWMDGKKKPEPVAMAIVKKACENALVYRAAIS